MAQKTLAGTTPRKSSSKPRKVVAAFQPTKWQHAEVNAAIDRGLADIAAGRVYIRRSYAKEDQR